MTYRGKLLSLTVKENFLFALKQMKNTEKIRNQDMDICN